MAETNNATSDPEPPPMDRQLLKACCRDDINLLSRLILHHDTNILLSVTPQGNNCLHLAAMLGHDKFARYVWSRFPPLFSCTNKDGETPLIAALMAANATLASDMLDAASQLLQPDIEGKKPLNEMLLKIDKRGDNALHHAIRNGFEDFALVLLNIEPQLSENMEPLQPEELEQEQSENGELQQSEHLDQALSEDGELRQSEEEEQSMSENGDSSHPMQNYPPVRKMMMMPGVIMTAGALQRKKSVGVEPSTLLPEDEDSLYPSTESLHNHKISESPMFMAARKGYSRLVERILEIPSSSEFGPGGYSVLEAAADDPGLL